jgi:uncharacterized protein
MKPRVTCPQCRKNPSSETEGLWPFCSERCKMVDLGKWAREEYRVEGPSKDMENRDAEVQGEDGND